MYLPHGVLLCEHTAGLVILPSGDVCRISNTCSNKQNCNSCYWWFSCTRLERVSGEHWPMRSCQVVAYALFSFNKYCQIFGRSEGRFCNFKNYFPYLFLNTLYCQTLLIFAYDFFALTCISLVASEVRNIFYVYWTFRFLLQWIVYLYLC